MKGHALRLIFPGRQENTDCAEDIPEQKCEIDSSALFIGIAKLAANNSSQRNRDSDS